MFLFTEKGDIDFPRDRGSDIEPEFVRKGPRGVIGLDEKIRALHAHRECNRDTKEKCPSSADAVVASQTDGAPRAS